MAYSAEAHYSELIEKFPVAWVSQFSVLTKAFERWPADFQAYLYSLLAILSCHPGTSSR